MEFYRALSVFIWSSIYLNRLRTCSILWVNSTSTSDIPAQPCDSFPQRGGHQCIYYISLQKMSCLVNRKPWEKTSIYIYILLCSVCPASNKSHRFSYLPLSFTKKKKKKKNDSVVNSTRRIMLLHPATRRPAFPDR